MYSSEAQKRLFETTTYLLQNDEHQIDIEQLKDVLIFHEWKYYVQDNPVISDFEYDQLFQRLLEIEAKHPELITQDSPSQRVGQDITDTFNKVTHLTPMLSLANSYNVEDLQKFEEGLHRLFGEESFEYTVEPKFDGGSLALVYEDDMLVRAATRGNGAMGEEMTANAKVIRTIPLKAAFSKYGIKQVELRGEAVIRKDRFEKINEERVSLGDEAFANPRNAATGGLRTKDPKETANRQIDLFVFQMSYAVDEAGNDMLPSFKTHAHTISILKELGFRVPKSSFNVYGSIQEVHAHCVQSEQNREAYPYELDGQVVKLNDFELQEKAGMTQHHPKWAIAFKFKAKQATSKLLHVEYQVGKIGSITPVAKIRPTPLAGVTVSSISLHNAAFIQSKDIRLGDQVLIERAGDVIPYIVKSLPDLRDGSEQPIVFPTHCPSCSSLLIQAEDEAAWRCRNVACEAQVIQRLIHHVSKDAMNIDGFGKSYVERFYELGWLKDMGDIYQLDPAKIEQLEGFGSKSAEKLIKAIDQVKQNPLHRILNSLCIHHLGRKASKVIAAHIDHMLDLCTWSEEKYTDIKDIGPVLAREMMQYFGEPKHIEVLKKMEILGVDLSQKDADKPKVLGDDLPLSGKTILFTGSLTQLKRKEAQAMAERAGAKNISAVSGNLDILVVGEKAGSKLKKAEQIGTVSIWTEAEFLDFLK